MTHPPPHRRGIRDIEQASDRSSAPGSQQNVFWKLFKLETRRLMAEREQKIAQQRAEIAARRATQAADKMRSLLGHDRVAELRNQPASSDGADHDRAAFVETRPDAAELVTHRYGARARRAAVRAESRNDNGSTDR